ncbi:MAG: hypothetical protein ABI740_06810, partial [Alphaproteobacteria bacterium]
MIPSRDSQSIEIESFEAKRRGGGTSPVQLRPVAGQRFATDLLVEGSKSLTQDYPVGTRFKVQVALTDRPDGGGQFLYTSWQWD